MSWKRKLNYTGVFNEKVDKYLADHGFNEGKMEPEFDRSYNIESRNSKALVLKIEKYSGTNNTVVVYLSNQELVFQRFDKYMDLKCSNIIKLSDYFGKQFQNLSCDDIDKLLDSTMV